MRSRARALFLLAATAAAISSAESPAPPDAPQKVLAFSRSLSNYFDRMENLVAREVMTQQIFNNTNGTVFRKRVLVSDFQIARLEEDVSSLWEFRFVRLLDGVPLDESGRQLADFLRLRHTNAREERLGLVRMAVTKSLPGCYWHNLALVLKAFDPTVLPNFAWKDQGSTFAFEQLRGLGIPEDFFDPHSLRHYPKGALTFSEPGGWLSAVELDFPSDEFRIRMRLRFSKPAPPDLVPLPKEFVVDRLRLSTGLPLTRTTFAYSDFQRFTVTSEDSSGAVAR